MPRIRLRKPKLKASCPDCFSTDAVRAGTQMTKKRGRRQRVLCNACGYIWLKDLEK